VSSGWAGGGGGGGGAVSSVFLRTGAVSAAVGDYTVAQVTGAAALASPIFTGTPAAPTAAPLTGGTQLATAGYSDAATLVEKNRALAAEALLAPLASPALTGNPTVPTQAPGTNSTRVASTAYGDAAVAVETARAEAAEALLAPLAGPAFTGAATFNGAGLANVATSGSAADLGGLQSLATLPVGGTFKVLWDGTTAHDFAGNVIVSRPSARIDITMTIQGGPAATPPGFQLTHDEYEPTS
jgi:hypothetical protein